MSEEKCPLDGSAVHIRFDLDPPVVLHPLPSELDRLREDKGILTAMLVLSVIVNAVLITLVVT